MNKSLEQASPLSSDWPDLENKEAEAIYRRSTKFIFFPLIFVLLINHLLALVGILFIRPTPAILLVSFSVYLLTGLGISIGYHRCLSHRAFEFRYRWLERVFVTLGAICFQGGPVWWCSLHRIHHRNSDTELDPSNATRGFWYGHVLYLAHLDPRWKTMFTPQYYRHLVKDISSDPYYYALDKYQLGTLMIIALWVIFYFIGGWPLFFWAGPIATVFSINSFLLLNSAAHLWGYESYPAQGNAKNNFITGILTHGDGWHNNHHAFPSSAKHGFFRWYEFDLSYLIIRLLKFLGLVSKVRLPDFPKAGIEKTA